MHVQNTAADVDLDLFRSVPNCRYLSTDRNHLRQHIGIQITIELVRGCLCCITPSQGQEDQDQDRIYNPI